MTQTTAVVWLRRDLRLRDNPALHHACTHADSVLLAYIDADDERGQWADGAATRWWLHHSLQNFAAAAGAVGRQLLIRRAPSMQAGLQKIAAEAEASLVTWNRLYEPRALERDHGIEAALRARGIEVQTFQGALLSSPGTSRQPRKDLSKSSRLSGDDARRDCLTSRHPCARRRRLASGGENPNPN